MQTICQKTTKQTTEYYAARWALKAISKVCFELVFAVWLHKPYIAFKDPFLRQAHCL